MSSSASGDPSPSGKFRVLEIKLQSADLNINKKGRVYVKLSVPPHRELQSSVKNFSPGSKPVWEDKFIFSVSENFLRHKNNNNIISFEVYRERKFLKDDLIGTTCCDLNSLFQPRYDDSVQDSNEEKYFSSTIIGDKDPSFHNMFQPEKDDDYDGKFSGEFDGSKKKKNKKIDMPAAALSATASLTAAKGLERKGTLKIEVAVWEGFIGCVGDHKWCNAAMPYDDFMGLTNPIKDDKKKKKKSLLHVFYM